MTASPHVMRRAILCVLLGLGIASGWAEQSVRRRVPSGSFGPVIAQPLAFEPIALCVLPARRGNVRPEIAVLARGEPAIHLFTLRESGDLEETATVGLPGLHRAVACGDLDGDREPELVAISSDDLAVTVVRRTRAGITQTALLLETPRSRLEIADITNDGKRDVLLFGRAATGIATVVSPRRGVFRSGPVLVPDVSVADARASDVNGDGVADLVMLDWLASRVEVLFGITDTVFSEAVSLPINGEPASLVLSRRVADRRATLAIAVPDRGTVLTMAIDPTGALVPQATLTMNPMIRALVLDEVTGDACEDLLVGGDETLTVFSGLGPGRFSAPAEFSVPAGEGLWEVADADGDGRKDLVVADRHARRLVVLGNARRGRGGQWPDVYAVGRKPREIVAIDCSGDGLQDLVVSNTQSATVSLLVNEGEGRFGGQQSYALPDPPSQLSTLVAPGGKTVFLLSSHAATDRISALVISDGELTKPELIVLETGADPHIQYSVLEGAPPLLRLLVRSRVEGSPGSVALSLFEQLRRDQFLERQFLARFPRRISALAVGEFLGSGTPDVVLANFERARQRTVLSIAPSRGAFEFTTVEPLTDFGDSLRGVRNLLIADLNNDRIDDLLVIPEAPRTRIGFLTGKGGGLSLELQWIRDVYPSREILPAVEDVTGDGHADIVMLDELRGAIVALYGDGPGTFRPPVMITPGSGVNGFSIGEFRHHGQFDLAITSGDQGVVSLLFNAFRP